MREKADFYIDIPKSMTEVIENKIREMIITDRLNLGAQLSEENLAKAFQVSKTPVREALLRLSLVEGLVDIKPRSGSFVFSITHEQIDKLSSLRLLLEREAIKSAMENNESALLYDLNKNINKQLKLISDDDFSDYRRLDVEFHRIILQHTNNPYLLSAYKLVDTKTYALRCRINFPHEYIARSIDFHTKIYECLCHGDIEKACDFNAHHINIGFTDRAKKLLQDND